MRILFLSDKSQNLSSWVKALEKNKNVVTRIWSMGKVERKFFSRLKRSLNILFAPIKVKKIIKEYNPDILIGYRIPSYGFISTLTNFKPVVVTAQGASDLWPPNSKILWLKKIILKYTINRSDVVHVWASHMAENMKNFGASKEKLFIMSRGINLNDFFISNDMENRSENKLRLICTRSMYEEYQHLEILRALVLLKQKFEFDFECVFIGSGPLKTSLIEFSEKNNLKNEVKFLGRVDNKNLPNLLNKSHIYISLPATEGLSASLLEAMACGCLPIVSNLPGNSELIRDGFNGFLVDPKSPLKIAERIQKVWKEKNMLYNISKINSKIIKEDFNIDNNVKSFLKKYSRLIKEYENKK